MDFPPYIMALPAHMRLPVLLAGRELGIPDELIRPEYTGLGRKFTAASADDTPLSLNPDADFVLERLLGSARCSADTDFEDKIDILIREGATGRVWLGEADRGVPLPNITERENGFPITRLLLKGSPVTIVAKAEALDGVVRLSFTLCGYWIRKAG